MRLEVRRRQPKKVIYREEVRDEAGNVVSPEASYTLGTEWKGANITGYSGVWSDRIYGMFARLAGVRDYYEGGSRQIIEERGFPDDACEDTIREYCSRVISDEEYKDREEKHWDMDDVVSETDAEKYLNNYGCKEILVENNWGGKDGKVTTRYVSGPDWHTPSWCTTEEMERCIEDLFHDKDKDEWNGDYLEWVALLGAMKGYERTGEFECRAVFWFDN